MNSPTLDELLSSRPPDELYHYTSQAGLIGILTNRVLWASKISHLNDASELFLALELAERLVKASDADERVKEQLLDDLDLMSHGSINMFVFSLSENDDQLSQWRGYAPPGAGYSIGFASTFLSSVATQSWRFTLGPCSYNPDIHQRIVGEIVEAAVRRRMALPQPAPGGAPPGRPFREALYFAAPYLKHPGFSEECEWRLVSSPVSHGHDQFRHRPGASHIVPYFEIPFGESEEGQRPIRKVIVGPTPHPQLATAAVATLLSRSGFSSWALDQSEIPYRQW